MLKLACLVNSLTARTSQSECGHGQELIHGKTSGGYREFLLLCWKHHTTDEPSTGTCMYCLISRICQLSTRISVVLDYAFSLSIGCSVYGYSLSLGYHCHLTFDKSYCPYHIPMNRGYFVEK